jgi:predicted nucleotidyltransferase
LDAIQQIELLAEKLGDLSEEVVVVGGCSPALILDINTAPDLRPTDDVDVMVQADNYGRYFDFIVRIKERGFVEREGDPIGRYTFDELVVDVMPTEADVLGFTNKWYKKAFAKAVYRELPSGKSIKTVTPVYFIATKFEAFRDRGKDDLVASPDLEDIITMMVETATFEEELRDADIDVQKYISEQFKELVSDENYPHFLSAHLRGDEASQAFLPELRQLIEKIASVRL